MEIFNAHKWFCSENNSVLCNLARQEKNIWSNKGQTALKETPKSFRKAATMLK